MAITLLIGQYQHLCDVYVYVTIKEVGDNTNPCIYPLNASHGLYNNQYHDKVSGGFASLFIHIQYALKVGFRTHWSVALKYRLSQQDLCDEVYAVCILTQPNLEVNIYTAQYNDRRSTTVNIANCQYVHLIHTWRFISDRLFRDILSEGLKQSNDQILGGPNIGNGLCSLSSQVTLPTVAPLSKPRLW